MPSCACHRRMHATPVYILHLLCHATVRFPCAGCMSPGERTIPAFLPFCTRSLSYRPRSPTVFLFLPTHVSVHMSCFHHYYLPRWVGSFVRLENLNIPTCIFSTPLSLPGVTPRRFGFYVGVFSYRHRSSPASVRFLHLPFHLHTQCHSPPHASFLGSLNFGPTVPLPRLYRRPFLPFTCYLRWFVLHTFGHLHHHCIPLNTYTMPPHTTC